MATTMGMVRATLAIEYFLLAKWKGFGKIFGGVIWQL